MMEEFEMRLGDWLRIFASMLIAAIVVYALVNDPTEIVQPSCGDGVCDIVEDCENCIEDCRCDDRYECRAGTCREIIECGDGRCQAGEDCGSCIPDCGCSGGSVCRNRQCAEPVCGDGVCSPFENEENCCRDCGCARGFECIGESCTLAVVQTDPHPEAEVIAREKLANRTITSIDSIAGFPSGSETITRVIVTTEEDIYPQTIIIHEDGTVEWITRF